MATNETPIIKELRAEILQQLKKATPANAPKVHERIQTQEGYADLEKLIIKEVLKSGLTPSACIPHIENEFI